jgi:sugar lactone lactonase YvrE
MLSTSTTKGNLLNYTASTLTVTGLPSGDLTNVYNGGMASDQKYVYLRIYRPTAAESGIYAVNLSTGAASQVCQQVNTTVTTPSTGVCVSANGTIFFSEADAPNPYIYWYSVGPFTGTLLTPTLLFSSSNRTSAYNNCGINKLAVSPDGTILYMYTPVGFVYKVTWSGGVGTFTTLASVGAGGIAVDGAGNLFASGISGFSLPNSLITPGGVATTITQTFYPSLNLGAYDSDGCPIIANGASNFLYKLKPPSASTTWTQITSTVTGSTITGITVHIPSRTIYVLDNTNGVLRTFTPNY